MPENSELAAGLDALQEAFAELLHPPRLPGHAASARREKLIDTLAQKQPPHDAERVADAGPSITIAGTNKNFTIANA